MSPNAIDAEIAQYDARSRQATQAGAQAFARLLKLAEERDSGHIARIARFLAATYNGQAFQLDLFELRAVDVAISDDMLCCLEALRWGRADRPRHSMTPRTRASPSGRCGDSDDPGRASPARRRLSLSAPVQFASAPTEPQAGLNA